MNSHSEEPGACSSPSGTLTPTQCRHCEKTFVDPRLLSCIHSFCLHCLQEMYDKCCSGVAESSASKDGTRLKCPTCRRYTAVPNGGVTELPRNYLMDTRVEKEKLSSFATTGDSAELMTCGFQRCASNRSTLASVYCTVCRTGLCDQCITTHRTSGMGNHDLRDVDDGRLDVADVDKLVVSYCDSHETEVLNVFCKRCAMVACTRCFIARHNGHPYTGLDELAASLRRQLQKEIECSAAVAEFDRKRLELVQVGRSKLVESVERVREDIVRRSDYLKNRIDSETNELLQRLNDYSDGELGELHRCRQEIENGLDLRTRFARHVADIVEQGSPIDLARSVSDVESKANGMGRSVGKRTFQTVGVSFKKATLSKKNLVGTLNLTESTKVIKP